MRRPRWRSTLDDLSLLILIAALLALILTIATPTMTGAACHQVDPDHPDVVAGWNPTGWRDCAHYGLGEASQWPGPGVARNDCLWPWTDCTPIRITSHETGRTVTVTPTMFCDCYTFGWGPYRERLVDLDPATLRALGIDPEPPRLYDVTVESAAGLAAVESEGTPPTDLPDTAIR